jgi:hypothetical protein
MERLPIVILNISGECVPFYADEEKNEYRAVDDSRMKFREDEINAPMVEVVQRYSVMVH